MIESRHGDCAQTVLSASSLALVARCWHFSASISVPAARRRRLKWRGRRSKVMDNRFWLGRGARFYSILLHARPVHGRGSSTKRAPSCRTSKSATQLARAPLQLSSGPVASGAQNGARSRGELREGNWRPPFPCHTPPLLAPLPLHLGPSGRFQWAPPASWVLHCSRAAPLLAAKCSSLGPIVNGVQVLRVFHAACGPVRTARAFANSCGRAAPEAHRTPRKFARACDPLRHAHFKVCPAWSAALPHGAKRVE